MQCSNNIKQLGLAMMNYESAHRKFPMAGTVDSDFSVQARLLPFVEQSNLNNLLDYSQVAFTGPFNAKVPNPNFATAFATPLPLFLCPSDPHPACRAWWSAGTTYSYGGLNYMISYGSGMGVNYDLRWRTDGVVYQRSSAGFRDIIDGSSNTVLLSESVRSIGDDMTLPAGSVPKFPYQYTLNGSGGVNSGLNAVQGLRGDRFRLEFVCRCQRHDLQSAIERFLDYVYRLAWTTVLRCAGRGISWAFGGAINSLTNGYQTPNNRIPSRFGRALYRLLCPRSYHTGGANVGLADGSVHFISDGINANVHRALHSCNGGEAIGEF